MPKIALSQGWQNSVWRLRTLYSSDVPVNLLFYFILALFLISILQLPSSSMQPPKIFKQHPALEVLPRQILWAWQRPEDLRWLPAQIGVAYVASSIVLESEHATVQPRVHPLMVKTETMIVPVVHVDVSWRRTPELNEDQTKIIVDELVHVSKASNGHIVQLDFEVRKSQRDFLAGVVKAARLKLADDIALSVTALASWCAGDHWIGELDADEIVPMTFRMAGSGADIRQLLANKGHFKTEHCQTAIGTAIDEPEVEMHPIHKIRHYYFSPKPWTQQLWSQQQWHI